MNLTNIKMSNVTFLETTSATNVAVIYDTFIGSAGDLTGHTPNITPIGQNWEIGSDPSLTFTGSNGVEFIGVSAATSYIGYDTSFDMSFETGIYIQMSVTIGDIATSDVPIYADLTPSGRGDSYRVTLHPNATGAGVIQTSSPYSPNSINSPTGTLLTSGNTYLIRMEWDQTDNIGRLYVNNTMIATDTAASSNGYTAATFALHMTSEGVAHPSIVNTIEVGTY